MVLQLLPDVEKAAIAYLAADVDVIAITQNIQPLIAAPYPMLRVVRTGGPAGRRLDRALLYLDAYGDVPDKRPANERATLNLLGRTAIAALRLFATSPPIAGCDVSEVITGTVLQWLPDPLTAQGRYRSEVLIYARAVK